MTRDGAGALRSLSALRHREFRLFQAARFATVIGLQMQGVAVAWQVYALTHDPLQLGYVGLAQFLPAVVLSLFAGDVADRVDRRRVLVVCYALLLASSLGLLLFALAANPGALPIYGVLLLIGTARAFSGPAGSALMPNLVPAADFSNAIAWSGSVWQVANIAGPALGGALYAVADAPAVYGAAALLEGLSLAMLLALRPRPAPEPAGAESWQRLLAGIGFVWRKKILLGALSLDLFAVLLGGAVALLPVIAKDVLHTGPAGLGALRSAPAVGATLTALALAARPLERRAGPVMFGCVALFGIATVVFGLSRTFALSLGALAVGGAVDMVSVFVRHNVVQLSTPDSMRGRVSAVNLVFIGASNELGEFESGLTAAWLGTVPAIVLGGIGTCVVVALCALLFPALRKVDRMDAATLAPEA